ncbi:MAG: hypothetical protein ACRD4F_16305, partial [Candidatus Angelobacter sp.]
MTFTHTTPPAESVAFPGRHWIAPLLAIMGMLVLASPMAMGAGRQKRVADSSDFPAIHHKFAPDLGD